MNHQLYNIILTCLLILSFPYLLLRSLVQERFRKRLFQRMGFLPRRSVKRLIWIHAASVGEVFCSIPLIKRIKQGFPQCEIVLTTVTHTGNEAAKASLPEADEVLFFPVDHPLTIGRAIKRIKPSLLLIAETELWPNLLRSCGKKGIPIILFNGRISQKSFRRYLFFKSLFRECLQNIRLFLMQTEKDRERIIEIGAPQERTRVLGNLKFDQTFQPPTQETLSEMTQSIGLKGDETVLVAGSTHSGEEEILITLFKDLRKNDPHLLLILAPRHLERLEEVERILKKANISWIRRTLFSLNKDHWDGGRDGPPEVILLDTMGELTRFYSLGTLAFIGGSLVPVGGHNPLEPLFFQKCTLFGPHMFNFLEITQSLIEAGGAIQVKGRKDLYLHLKRLLTDEGERKRIGERGYQFLQRHQGATEKTFEEIRHFIQS